MIDAFVARGLIRSVVRRDRKDAHDLAWLVDTYYDMASDIAFYVESDVVVQQQEACWTDRLQAIMDRNPRLAMLGSRIDETDFVSRDRIAQVLQREPSQEELDAIKWFSPERTMPAIADDEVALLFNPPGRPLAPARRLSGIVRSCGMWH